MAISDLILAEGDAKARGIASRGAMWGDLVGQSALSFGNVLQSRQVMKAAQAKRAAVQRAFSGAQPPSIADLVNAGIEPQDAIAMLADYAKTRPESVKPQAVETVDDAGNPVTQFVTPTAGTSYKKPKPVEKKGTREVKTRNADGSESIQIVEDTPGQAFTSAPVPKDGPKVGSEEDFIKRFATSLGKPVEQLTDAQIASARRRYASQTHFETPAAPKSQEWVTRNGQVIPIQPGTAQAGDVPYDEVAARQKAGVQDGPSPYAQERAARIVSSIDGITKRVSGWNTGPGAVLANLPATDARKLHGDLNELKANIAFNELTAMREASKTGGALGSVAVRELELLESALGSLDQYLAPADLTANLAKIKASVVRWNSAKAQTQLNPGAMPDWVDAGGGFKVREKR